MDEKKAREMMEFVEEIAKLNLSEEEKGKMILFKGMLLSGGPPKICKNLDEMIKDNPWVPAFEEKYKSKKK